MQDLIWGWSGTLPVKVLVDADGHLQVDVLASALPTGAATEATLADVESAVDGIETLLAGGLPSALDADSLKVKEQGTPSVHLYGYDGAAWQTLLVESAALKNLRVKLYDGADGAGVWQIGSTNLPDTDYGLIVNSVLRAFDTSASYMYPVETTRSLGDAHAGTRFFGVSLMAFNGATWDRLRVESAAAFNLRTKLYDGANGIQATVGSSNMLNVDYGLQSRSGVYGMGSIHWQACYGNDARFDNRSSVTWTLLVSSLLYGYDGSYWDRLRTYGTGILKVARAEAGLSDNRLTAAGAIKGSAGKLYWLTFTGNGGAAVVDLSDDTDGSTAAVWTGRCLQDDSKHYVFDPPLEFATGIYLKTATNTEVTAGYL